MKTKGRRQSENVERAVPQTVAQKASARSPVHTAGVLMPTENPMQKAAKAMKQAEARKAMGMEQSYKAMDAAMGKGNRLHAAKKRAR